MTTENNTTSGTDIGGSSEWFETPTIDTGSEAVETPSDDLVDLNDAFNSEPSEQVTEEQPAESETSPSNKISIDIKGEIQEFNLDPNDETLRGTLRKGVKFEKLKGAYDNIKSQVEQYKTDAETYKASHEGMQVLNEYVESGDYDTLFNKVLGQENFNKYLEGKITEFLAYQEATPEERAAMDLQRKSKMMSESERQKDKRIKELEEREAKREEDLRFKDIEKLNNNAYVMAALTEQEVADKDIRHKLNVQIWRNSIEDIKTLGSTLNRELTAADFNRVFKENAAVQRKIMNVQPQVKQEVKQTVAAAAKQAMPSSKTDKLEYDKGFGAFLDSFMKRKA